MSDDDFAIKIIEIIKEKLSLEELESLVTEYKKQWKMQWKERTRNVRSFIYGLFDCERLFILLKNFSNIYHECWKKNENHDNIENYRELGLCTIKHSKESP